MPTPRTQFAIAEYQGKIYCIGGIVDYTTWPDGSIFSLIACNLNEVYDTATDSWSTKAAMPVNGSYNLHAHVVNGKIFVLFGCDLFMYEPVTDVWTNKTGIHENSEKWNGYSISSIIIDGKIIAFCKFVYFDIVTPYNSYQKTLTYDPKTDVWSEIKDGNMDVAGDITVVTTGRYAPQRIYALGMNYLGDNT
ncbi:MAG: hypothetical protein FWF66_04350 [Candidatus Bathyarchaeota archaeon]|nr:hypothetical protein [Candidatus Termiticorpusculum sp.]